MQYYVVIDTNVLVSAILRVKSVPWRIVNESLLGRITPLISNDIISEYREVLSRAKFKFDQDYVEILINGIIDRGIFVDAVSVDEELPDSDDVIFYEVVVESYKERKNSFLVTGNIKHFPIKTFIVTPKEMLDILDNND